MLLPNDPAAREIIQKALQEAMISKIKIDDATQHIADVATYVQTKTGMKPDEFKKRLAVRYKEQTDPKKYERDREIAENIYVENDLLKD